MDSKKEASKKEAENERARGNVTEDAEYDNTRKVKSDIQRSQSLTFNEHYVGLASKTQMMIIDRKSII